MYYELVLFILFEWSFAIEFCRKIHKTKPKLTETNLLTNPLHTTTSWPSEKISLQNFVVCSLPYPTTSTIQLYNLLRSKNFSTLHTVHHSLLWKLCWSEYDICCLLYLNAIFYSVTNLFSPFLCILKNCRRSVTFLCLPTLTFYLLLRFLEHSLEYFIWRLGCAACPNVF